MKRNGSQHRGEKWDQESLVHSVSSSLFKGGKRAPKLSSLGEKFDWPGLPDVMAGYPEIKE
jgi:hypothetical protein